MTEIITKNEIGSFHIQAGYVKHITIIPGFEFDYIRSIKKMDTKENVRWELCGKFKRPRFLYKDYAIAESQAVIRYSNEVIELIAFSEKLSSP